MKAKWQGDLVAEILHVGAQISLHSQFVHGVNLTVNDELLFIGDTEKGCVPFGIHLSHSDFTQFQQQVNWKMPISVTEQGLAIGSLRIDLDETPIYLNQLERKPASSCRLSQENLSLLKEQLPKTGLDFGPLLTQGLLLNPSQEDGRAFVNYYLGRGLGLTPAGDDFTIGLLAVDQLTPFLPADFTVYVEEALVAERTTVVSKSYLRSGIKGHFSSLVIDVLTNLTTPLFSQALAALAASGSTSGCDTLAGILYGLLHIKRINDNN